MTKIKQFTVETLVVALVCLIGVLSVWSGFAPQLLLAQTTDSDQVIVNLTVDSEITINSPPDTTMTPNIAVSNSTSTGTTTWTVTTNDTDGFTLSVRASTSPAMQSGADSFADFTESTSDVPEAWTVATGDFEFGYSATGTTVNGEFGAGDLCVGAGGDGDVPTDKNYLGFTTTTRVIASSTSVTPFDGTEISVCYAAEQSQVFAPSGAYSATITGTASVQ